MVDLLLQELPEEAPVTQELRLISEKLEAMLHIFGEVRRLARGASGPGGANKVLNPHLLSRGR
jgi:hypothetical protein